MSSLNRLTLVALTVSKLCLFAAPARADIYRWDNGEVIPGTEEIEPGPGVQLDHRELEYAELNYGNLTDARFDFSNLSLAQLFFATLTNANLTGANLTRARLDASKLTNVDLTGANLTRADLYQSTLTNANLTGAVVTSAGFSSTTFFGFTKAQLESTASYQAKNLRNIRLAANDLTGWDFSGQNLTGADLFISTLTNADLTGANLTGAFMQLSTLTNADLSFADTRAAIDLDTAGTNTRNMIWPDGSIQGLELASGDSLVVRNYHGLPFEPPQRSPIAVQDYMTMDDGGVLQLQFDTDAWDSTISFQPGIPVTLGGTLELTFTDGVDVATQIGRTLHIFEWTGVEPTGAFTLSSLYPWDVSQLYTSGEVTLLLPGDTNGDQTVELNDLNNVRNNFGGDGIGDTNNDGIVDLIDLNNVRNFFGVTVPQAVPEPSSLALLALGAAGIVARRRMVRP